MGTVAMVAHILQLPSSNLSLNMPPKVTAMAEVMEAVMEAVMEVMEVTIIRDTVHRTITTQDVHYPVQAWAMGIEMLW